MAKTLFTISWVLLLALLVLHVLTALIWGNWDQEGTGSLGFWPVFSTAISYYAWVYVVLIGATLIFWGFKGRSTKKRNERP